MNILFICKHNRFRSRVANSYFDKINKSKNFASKGCGLFSDNNPLDESEIKAAMELGIDITGKPIKLNSKLIEWSDLIVVVADDVPDLFANSNKQVLRWEIKDCSEGDSIEDIKKTVKLIMNNVEKLLLQLEKEAK